MLRATRTFRLLRAPISNFQGIDKISIEGIFLSRRVCICWNKLPSNVVGAGTVNEFKSRLTAHFAISPLLYDHRATWDSREGLDAGSLHSGAAGSCSAEHRSRTS